MELDNDKNRINDILISLSSLGNDEVFTPPRVVNEMLDMFPVEIYSDPALKWLDPVCKSGVYLREIAKRLYDGLKHVIVNDDERREHIFSNMLYGIAISPLTALMSRRSLYGNKNASNKNLSLAKTITKKEGNIYYDTNLPKNEYMFINKLPKELENMKFDVIIGNPPYQYDDGGAGASASPLYHKFVEQAIAMKPRYVSFIIPARWYTGGKGLDNFRKTMLADNRMQELHDYADASECFKDVEIKGGVCYFLWNRAYEGDCTVINHNKDKTNAMTRPLKMANNDVLVRFNEAIAILEKVQDYQEDSFSTIVSSAKAFGLRTFFRDCQSTPPPHDINTDSIKLYYYDKTAKVGYVKKEQLLKNHDWVDKWKVYMPEAFGSGNFDEVKPFIGEPNTACTETYLVIGPFASQSEAESCQSYMQTQFFSFMVALLKYTQHSTPKVYKFVPLVPFDHIYTNQELYKKYDLEIEQIAYIESMVRPMGDKTNG